MHIHLNAMLAFSLIEEALEMRRIMLIIALVILVASSCNNTNIEINENAEIILKDELQSLYAEIIIKHDYHDIETDFSCTLLYKAYGIYSVNLSDAVVSVSDSTIRVMLPHAKLGHFGIKDEEFEILGASGDSGFSGHFLDGGQLAGIEMADNERAMIENEAYEKAWLFRVASNLSKNRISYNKIRSTDELNESLIAEEREDLSFVWEAVKELPVKYKEVIHLFYYEELSTAEIANILQKKESTVRSHLMRGREKLKSILKEAYDFE